MTSRNVVEWWNHTPFPKSVKRYTMSNQDFRVTTSRRGGRSFLGGGRNGKSIFQSLADYYSRICLYSRTVALKLNLHFVDLNSVVVSLKINIPSISVFFLSGITAIIRKLPGDTCKHFFFENRKFNCSSRVFNSAATFDSMNSMSFAWFIPHQSCSVASFSFFSHVPWVFISVLFVCFFFFFF